MKFAGLRAELFAGMILVLAGRAWSGPGPALIPWPAEVREEGTGMALADGARLIVAAEAGDEWEASARLFADKVLDRHGVRIEVVMTAPQAARTCPAGTALAAVEGGCAPCAGAIVLSPDGAVCGGGEAGGFPEAEGYRLTVNGGAAITAASASGAHNGLMTLLQLIGGGEDGAEVPGVVIVDGPRFKWRGMLLDSARSFLPADVVKAYIDRLSELKLNVLHWHLVDDQGWRIESAAYPKLHEASGVVSNMADDKLAALARVKLDARGRREAGGRYADAKEAAASRGYYTRDELNDIVAYAAARHVMIVPEIDVPGHSTAMLAAYPELSCSGETVELAKVGQMPRNALCPGKESVYEFLDALFGEVAEIFPAPYVHIGSDEVWTTKWMDAPENQGLIEQYGYTDNNGLQSYFVGRVNEILAKRGKTMIAWDEVTEYAPPGSVVQAWRKHEFARTAAERGNAAIVSPVTHCYIDYPQLQFTLKNLYHFEPLPEGLAPELAELILGGEVNLWGERVTLENIDRKAFPRVLAHAEVMWSRADARDWRHFTKRLDVVGRDMERRGIGFGKTWRGGPWGPGLVTDPPGLKGPGRGGRDQTSSKGCLSFPASAGLGGVVLVLGCVLLRRGPRRA